MFPFLTQPCSHVLSVSLSGNVSDGKHVQSFVKFSPQIRISFLNSRLPLLSRPDYLRSLMRASTSSSESNSTFFISNSWLMKPRSKASTEFLLHLNFFHEIDNLPKKQNNKRSQNVKVNDFFCKSANLRSIFCRNGICFTTTFPLVLKGYVFLYSYIQLKNIEHMSPT